MAFSPVRASRARPAPVPRRRAMSRTSMERAAPDVSLRENAVFSSRSRCSVSTELGQAHERVCWTTGEAVEEQESAQLGAAAKPFRGHRA